MLYACFCIPCNSCFTSPTINVLVAYWPDLSSHASINFLPCSDFLKCWISPLCLWSSDFQHSLQNITQLTWEIFSIRLTMFDEVLHTTLVKYNIHFKWLKTVFDESKSFFGTCLAIFWLSFLNILHLQQVGGADNDLVCQWVLFYPENNLVGHYRVIL